LCSDLERYSRSFGFQPRIVTFNRVLALTRDKGRLVDPPKIDVFVRELAVVIPQPEAIAG
jgi:hypothetical protein